MNKFGSIFLALTCLMTTAPLAAHAQSPQVDQSVTRTQGDRPGAVIERTGEIQARVVNINYDTREISLQSLNGQGKVITLKAAEGVTRFNQIKSGDQVKVRVTETLAITVAAPGAMSTPSTGMTNQATADGRTVTAAGRTSAVVSAISYPKREVTLTLQNGKSETFKVGKDVTRFNQIKKGDVVLMSYTAAVATSIVQAPVAQPAP
jgi:TolA-binding protein